MEQLFSKLSSYDFINYILFGTIFCITGLYLDFSFIRNFFNEIDKFPDVLQILFFIAFAYFLGLLISRSGSFIEPFFVVDSNSNKKKLIKSAPYADYVKAEKIDPKVAVLAMTSNLYRSFVGMFILLFLFSIIKEFLPFLLTVKFQNLIILFILILIFLFAWKKQVNYVRKRVEKNNSN